jgi:peptidoglycan/LPS O-acetylase OafA/YrhL
MTATSTTFTIPETVTRPAGTTKRIWKTAAVAGVTAAVATSAVAGVASAAGVSLAVGGQAIPVPGFAQLTLVGALIGAILAVVLSHRASRPRRTFVATTVVLTALSVIPDLTADAAGGTRLLLALTHVVAAAIVIPALASRLSD